MKEQYENLTNEEFTQMKKDEYKRKKMRQQSLKNAKSHVGFGYDYRAIQFNITENKGGSKQTTNNKRNTL